MAEDPKVTSELSRELSLFQITMMGLGMMIGAGVFLGIGNAVFEAGPGGVILTFALNGVLALLTAMSYAELSSAVPRAGGAYNFARIGFGRGPSFLAGWMEWFASSVAGSLYAVTFAIYVVRFLSVVIGFDHLAAGSGIVEKVLAAAIAIAFVYINYRGASETGRIGAVFTLGQTIFLVVIGVIGVFTVVRDPGRLENFDPFLPNGWTRLLVTMGFTYVAFEGYEVIAQAGEEVIDARRNLPKAMIYCVAIVTFTYVLVAFASVVAVKAGSPGVEGEPWMWIGSFREKGFGEAIARLLPAGNILLTLAVIFASTSALNATVYSATRASYALGRDGMLPKSFAKISSKKRTPWVALIFTGCIVVAVATLLPTRDVASSASIMFLFLFLLVNVSVIKIRRNMKDELNYGFMMPFFPLFPLVAIVLQAVLSVWLIHMSLIAWIVAPAWILAGLAFYWFYSRSRVIPAAEEIQVIEEDKAPDLGGYRVMVAVSNPDTALALVRNTYVLCDAKEASVELLHMVPVPDQVPLSSAGRYMNAGKEAIGEIMLYLAPMFHVSTAIRYCRNVARGIVSAVREKKVNLLVMGWHGQTRSRSFRLGSTVDPVVELVPCNVVIMKDCGDKKLKRVLVPVAGGPNSAFALEIGGIIAARNDGELVALTVRSKHGPRFDIEKFVEGQLSRMKLPADRVSTKVEDRYGVVESILKEAADPACEYDVVVLGCTSESPLRRVARDSVPETVARMCEKPVIMVKASGGISSWINRWI